MIWYFARSSGIVAYALLSASVVIGILMAGRTRFTWPRFAVEEVHRFLTIVTAVFITVHGASLLLDKVVPIGLGQEVAPFTDRYRPFAVGLGIVAAEAGVAGGVDQVDLAPLPVEMADRRGERHLAPLLVLVPVGGRRALLDRAEPVDRSGLEEHRLDERGLARPAMADDGDVTDLSGLGWHR